MMKKKLFNRKVSSNQILIKNNKNNYNKYKNPFMKNKYNPKTNNNNK